MRMWKKIQNQIKMQEKMFIRMGEGRGLGTVLCKKNCNSGLINITESKARKLTHSNDRVIDWCYNIYRLAVK